MLTRIAARRALSVLVAATISLIPATAFAGSGEEEVLLSAHRTSDYDRAPTIWLELAERGEAKAQSALGFLYLSGLRVEQSDKEAARWFEAAAIQGVPEAQYYLGTMYLEGRSVRSDPAAAHFWCELAISLGLTDALQAAYYCSEQAARSMTKNELATSRSRVNYWPLSWPPPSEIKSEPTMW